VFWAAGVCGKICRWQQGRIADILWDNGPIIERPLDWGKRNPRAASEEAKCCNLLFYKALRFILILAALACPAAPGQQAATTRGPTRAEGYSPRGALAGQKVMEAFDFEERNVHFESLPMYWQKVRGRQGFPHYSTGRLDTNHCRSGEYSFLLIPDGGSVGFEYHRRRIQAKAGSGFQIVAYVHFEQARSCRAQLSCVLTDRTGQPIPGSHRSSALAGPSEQGIDGWARMEIYVPGDFPQARFIQPSLWVLQEQQWRETALVDREVFRPDVKARAWFDDVTINQLPRVLLRTSWAGNAFEEDERAGLQVEVSGVSNLDYEVQLTVRNGAGQQVHEEAWILAGVMGEAQVRPIKLPNLAAGWYQAKLAIMSGGTVVATRELAWAKLAQLSGSSSCSGQGFGVLALGEQMSDWDTTMALIRSCNARLVKMPVWRKRREQGNARFSADSFGEELIQLQQDNIELIATFSNVPDSMAVQLKVGSRSLLDVLSRDVQYWGPEVSSVLAQYARQVPYWQIGADRAGEEQLWDPRIRPVVDSMRREFNQLVSSTVLAVPLSSMFGVDYSQVGTRQVALAVPTAITPKAIPQYLSDSRGRGLDQIWATLEPLDERYHRREDVLIDFARRVAFAKKGLAEAVFVERPWVERLSNGWLQTEPSELLLVFRTLSDYLGGAQYLGEFEMAEGVPALIFEGDGRGMIFTWNENYDPAVPQRAQALRLFLGDAPEMVDLFGNRKALQTTGSLTTVDLTNWPVLLTGIDTPIALLRASLVFAPNVVDASISAQQVTVKFENAFKSPISGQIRFGSEDPRYQQWLIEPSVLHFTLAAHAAYAQQINMRLPRNELGGNKGLAAFVTIDAQRSYHIRLQVPFEIRLSGVDVSLFTQRANDRDLVIQMIVTNESDKEVSLVAFADLPAPDGEHIPKLIPRLAPGAVASKSFYIADAVRWLGKYIRVGLYDPKGTKRINYRVDIN